MYIFLLLTTMLSIPNYIMKIKTFCDTILGDQLDVSPFIRTVYSKRKGNSFPLIQEDVYSQLLAQCLAAAAKIITIITIY